jgi:molybdopterin synthase sulfur carrier subunit
MPYIEFTRALDRYLNVAAGTCEGKTVSEALAGVFDQNPRLRSYIVDELGTIRKHVKVYVDGSEAGLQSVVKPESEIYVLQALSGG